MKNKVIISCLLVVLLFSFSLVKVFAYAEEEEEQLYYTYEETFTYPIELRSTLLDMRSGTLEDTIIIRNFVESTPTYITSFVENVGFLDWSFSITTLAYRVLYFSIPDFERGYYIELTSIDVDVRLTHNNDLYTGYSVTLPIDDNWTLQGSPYIYLGVDKHSLENGVLPFIMEQSVEDYILCSLTSNLEVYLVSENDVPSLEFNLEYYYFGDYKSRTRIIPVDYVMNVPFDVLPFVQNANTAGVSSANNLVPPPIYFTYLQNEYDNAYDRGFTDGKDEGYRLGYSAGQSSLNVDFTSWIVTATTGFLSFQILPGLSIFAILSFIISLGLLFLIIRFFAGG